MNWKDDSLMHLIDSSRYKTGTAKYRYFTVLRFLYEKDSALFAQKLESFTRGTRVHISHDANCVEESGSSTKPERLEGTPYFVLTDLDNNRKRTVLRIALKIFRYPAAIIDAVLKSIPDSPHSRGKHARSYIHEYGT